ncbi:MAG: sigma-70 family RNA polymerase sigma factor, partial [Actinomycetota bacterium]
MTVARSPATTDFFEDLLDAAAHGDPRALDALNRRYIGRLTAAARSMGAIDPEGAANQALFDGIRSIGTLRSRHEAPFRRYLHACVANQVRSEHRIQRPSLVALDPAVHGAAPWLDPAELVVGRGWFDAALEELPSEQRAVIRERFEVGRTVAETASTLGKTNDSVKHLQARGLRRIGRFLTAAGLVAVLIALGFLAAQHRRT